MDARPTVLSLCAGIGGIDVALRRAANARTVCYVEREAFACAVLVAQMERGGLDAAPIWSDLQTFDAQPWCGLVDIVAAGFPCQPHSHAGRREGTADERWIWDDIVRIVRDVRPCFVFLENVPGLATSGLDRVLGSLAACGFDAEWDCITAQQVGAPHVRERLFILAWDVGHAVRARSHGSPEAHQGRPVPANGRSEKMADTDRHRQQDERQRALFNRQRPSCGTDLDRYDSAFPPGPDSSMWAGVPPDAQPAVCRSADGLSARVDRLRALGNAVVPQQVELAFRTLLKRAMTL